MASVGDVVAVAQLPDQGVVHHSLISIQLEVVDPEVIAELQKQAEGTPRDRYASGALRLGVLALRQASGELDSTAIRQAGEDILHQLDRLLTERGTTITGEIGSALRQYFDPTTGA